LGLDDYGYDRGEQFHAVGAEVRSHNSFDVGDELVIMATLAFGAQGDGLLHVFEAVHEVGGDAHRRKYAYHFSYGDDFLFSYDRDPVAHPEMPEHKHVPGRGRVPWDRVTFSEVVDEIADYVAQREV
jgi:uncharacterized protein DUF6516